MAIIVSNIKLSLDDNDEVAFKRARKSLRISESQVKNIYIYKKSLDARRRDNVHFMTSVAIELFEKEAEAVKSASDSFVSYKENKSLEFVYGNAKLENPILIIGFGPAGIFAAYVLSKLGYKPIVFEKGECIEKRVHSVNEFWKQGTLNEKSNVQFGEGGAGTFSDGKLTTRISDGRCEYILNEFVKNGAPSEILATSRPHIGTDKLRGVISSMRNEIIKNGGQVFFEKSLDEIIIKDGAIYSAVISGNEIRTDNLILAIGHSSRDTFEMLQAKGVSIESKSFSIGVRIEQLQSTIDKGLYGDLAGNEHLPIGEYQLSHRIGNSCVYTFCMCPGGVVVPSCSSEGCVVTNGMSEHARSGENANSALVVSVSADDFGNKPLDGMNFQKALERKAFAYGSNNYKAPAMTVSDFMNHESKLNIKTVTPSYALGVTAADFFDIFPHNITKMMTLGLKVFDSKLKGFSNPDGILTGVETRTSSPIRILRNDDLISKNVLGLYPCGEGAGYAGGIMSAAADGIKVAEQIISKYAIN